MQFVNAFIYYNLIYLIILKKILAPLTLQRLSGLPGIVSKGQIFYEITSVYIQLVVESFIKVFGFFIDYF